MRTITAGSTSNILDDVFIQDATASNGAGLGTLAYNTSGLTCYYKRSSGSASVAVTLANITTLGTFVSGGFKPVDAANMPGIYEFHPPDAAMAAGAKSVTFYFQGVAGMAPAVVTYTLSAFDLQTAGVTLTAGEHTLISGSDVPTALTAQGYTTTLATNLGTTNSTVATNLNATVGSRSTYSGGAVASVTGNVGGSVVGDVQGKVLGGGASTIAAAGAWALSGSGAALATHFDSTTNLAAIQAITANTARAKVSTPTWMERPDSGSTTFELDLNLYSLQGLLEDADSSTVTVAARDTAGTSLNANLGSTTMTRISAGRYKVIYTCASSHAEGEVLFDYSWAVGGTNMALTDATVVNDAEKTSTLQQIAAAVGSGTAGASGGLPLLDSNGNAPANVNRWGNAAITGMPLPTGSYTAPPSAAALASQIFTDLLSSSDFSTAGSFGALVKTNLDAQVSSRLATSGYTAPDNADVVTALADVVSIQTSVSSGLATAVLAVKTQTDKIGTTAADSTSVTAIKAKTDNLPPSPAATGAKMDLVNAPNATAVTAIQGGLATLANQATIISGLGANIPVTSDSVATAISATAFSGTSALSAFDGSYINMVVVFTSGANARLARKITAYAGSTKQITVDSALPATPGPADTFDILGYSG